MKTSNVMFHVKHTLAALALGCVLVTPHAEAATTVQACLAMGDLVQTIAERRDAGVSEETMLNTIAAANGPEEMITLTVRVTSLIYTKPFLLPPQYRAAFLSGCLKSRANL